MMVALASLIALVLVIVVCAKKGTNPGILGLFISFILGFFIVTENGVTVSSVAGGCNAIFSGFPLKFFLLWRRRNPASSDGHDVYRRYL